MKRLTIGRNAVEALSLIPEGVIKKLQAKSRTLGITRKAEIFYVFDAFCPHRGASLIQGSINPQNEIICPLHQYRFELKTGKVKAGYCSDLETYPWELSQNGLIITLPE